MPLFLPAQGDRVGSRDDPVNQSDPSGAQPVYNVPEGTCTGSGQSCETVYNNQEQGLQQQARDDRNESTTVHHDYLLNTPVTVVLRTPRAVTPVQQSVGYSIYGPSMGCENGVDFRLGACPGERGAAGTTAGQVKQAMIGADFIIATATTAGLFDAFLAGAGGFFSSSADLSTGLTEDVSPMSSFLDNGATVSHSETATAIGDDSDTMQNFLRSRGAAGHDVIVHGDAEGNFWVNGMMTHPQQIADAILDNPDYNGDPINLVTCHGACGAAQDLADILGVEVNASTFPVLGPHNRPVEGAFMVELELSARRPLGVFGPRSGKDLDLYRDQMNELRGRLDKDVRQRVAGYLSGGTTIFALMEYTTDILEGAFGVSGGSAILSDGSYYWRRDAADYVRHYGIDIGPDGLSHMSSNDWVPPKLSQEETLKIDRYLYQLFRNHASDRSDSSGTDAG